MHSRRNHQTYLERDLAARRFQGAYLGPSNVERRMGRAVAMWTIPNRQYDSVCKELGHHGRYLLMIYEACQADQYASSRTARLASVQPGRERFRYFRRVAGVFGTLKNVDVPPTVTITSAEMKLPIFSCLLPADCDR
jgi:hypothetical protein